MGCATGPENNKNKPTKVDVLVFFYRHSTRNLLICQLQVYFSQECSPAYLRLFWGEHVGSVETSRDKKMAKNRGKLNVLR